MMMKELEIGLVAKLKTCRRRRPSALKVADAPTFSGLAVCVRVDHSGFAPWDWSTGSNSTSQLLETP